MFKKKEYIFKSKYYYSFSITYFTFFANSRKNSHIKLSKYAPNPYTAMLLKMIEEFFYNLRSKK